MNREQNFIDTALRMAEDLERFGEARVYAILTYRTQIISYGYNSSKSHTIATQFGRNEACIYPHAEVMAIHNASKRLDLNDFKKTTLFVARVKRPDRYSKLFIPGLAKPCIGCQGAINQFGIRKVIYTLDDAGYGIWNKGELWEK